MYAQQKLREKLEQETKHKCERHRNLTVKRFLGPNDQQIPIDEDYESQLIRMEKELLGSTIVGGTASLERKRDTKRLLKEHISESTQPTLS